MSSAQLAAAHPVSGGTYEYGYRLVSPLAGFAAGWFFLCAKSASAATAAIGFASYLLAMLAPDAASRWLNVGIAMVATGSLTLLIACGLRRSAQVNAVIVVFTVLTLLVYIFGLMPTAVAGGASPTAWEFPGIQSFLFTTGFMFVAYTGYGRIATLGEEVREPKTTIPKAILTTLAVSAGLYIAVTAVGLRVGLPTGDGNAASLTLSASAAGYPAVSKIVAVGAVTAMLGVLLNLILGLSRVVLAMGRRGDLPGVFANLDESGRGPIAATVLVGLVISSISLVGDVKLTWSFSAVTVLLYYATTNLAAIKLPPEDPLYHRAFPIAGLIGCLSLAFAVPWRVWSVAAGVFAVGLVLRTIFRSTTATEAEKL